MKKTIDQIARIDGRYDPKALKFIFEGLAETIDKIRKEEGSEDKPRHITGQELAGGLGELASRRWGRLAGMVLGQWGVHTTRVWRNRLSDDRPQLDDLPETDHRRF